MNSFPPTLGLSYFCYIGWLACSLLADQSAKAARIPEAMTTHRVYLETTVVGHLTGRIHPDPIISARQKASLEWWSSRNKYELYISQIVMDECAAGDSVAAAERIQLIAEFPLLDIADSAIQLAEQLILLHAIPATQPRDALHISIAAVHGLQYLLTWNFRHIANASTRRLIESTCTNFGFPAPTICTPEELLGE